MNEPSSNEYLKKLRDIYDIALNDDEDHQQDQFPQCYELTHEKSSYELKELLGQGGMKSVYKAYDKKCQRDIAYAQLRDSSQREKYESFLREARLTAKLKHPNIIKIYDIGISEEGYPYFTMELKSGEPLSYYCDAENKKELDMDQKLEIFFKICDAIEYAHTKHILHLDLKPENIQIGQHGEVLVCDWGLSAFSQEMRDQNYQRDPSVEVLDNLTLEGEVCGTPGYMAPEQLVKGQAYNVKADVFSLGCLLYRLIKARDLITGETLEEKIEQTKNIDKLVENEEILFENIPQSISAIIKKSVSEDKVNRYDSVSELKKDLKRYTNGFAALAEGQNFQRDAFLFYCRNKTLINIIVLCFFFVIFSTTIFVLQLQNKKNEVEKLLLLNQLEKEWSEEFIADNISAIKKSVYQLTDNLVFEDPDKSFKKSLAYLDRMIAGQPNFKWGYAQRAYVYFLMQEFELAYQDYEMAVNGSPFYKRLCEEYRKRVTSVGVLPVEDMKALFNELSEKNNQHLALIFCLYDSVKRNSLTEHTKIVELLLKCYNKNWDGFLEYIPEKKHLHITGRLCNKLSVDTNQIYLIGIEKENKKLSLLKSLPVSHLSIGNHKLEELKSLATLNLKSLDVSKSRVIDWTDLSKFKSLKELILSTEQMGILKKAHLDSLEKINYEVMP